MAKTKTVAIQTQNLLEEFNEEVRQVTEKAMEESAKEAASKLRATSPEKSGAYAKGWSVKKTDKMTRVVYNKTHYQLTHLLENGHVIRNQFGEYGRVNGIKHIEPVEEWAAGDVVERIDRKL